MTNRREYWQQICYSNNDPNSKRVRDFFLGTFPVRCRRQSRNGRYNFSPALPYQYLQLRCVAYIYILIQFLYFRVAATTATAAADSPLPLAQTRHGPLPRRRSRIWQWPLPFSRVKRTPAGFVVRTDRNITNLNCSHWETLGSPKRPTELSKCRVGRSGVP
jgi:hypothetical protein